MFYSLGVFFFSIPHEINSFYKKEHFYNAYERESQSLALLRRVYGQNVSIYRRTFVSSNNSDEHSTPSSFSSRPIANSRRQWQYKYRRVPERRFRFWRTISAFRPSCVVTVCTRTTAAYLTAVVVASSSPVCGVVPPPTTACVRSDDGNLSIFVFWRRGGGCIGGGARVTKVTPNTRRRPLLI